MRRVTKRSESPANAFGLTSVRRAALAGLAVIIAMASGTLAAQAQATSTPVTSAADVKFMQGMIHHHAQAIEMTNLMAGRTTSAAMRSLGERISISQKDEILMMQNWLREHHQDAPDPLPHLGMDMGDHDAHMMPGMLTKAQMAALAAAKGAAFDRLFLTGMIQHHEGALTMVKELFATSGAANNTAIFRFASDVDADQRAEIARMRAMLKQPKSK
jgi:uncharacterized protein (DUF305 family)